MSKEKQIEELTKILLTDCEGACTDCEYYERYDGSVCIPMRLANVLYNAGYRKQSEGEWKQTEESMGWGSVDCVVCSACGESWVLGEDFDFDMVKDFWNFCPNCGAKMKGGAE